MSAEAFTTILLQHTNATAWVVLNRPQVHNAMNSRCIEECRTALAQASADPAVRVVVFAGAGERAFTAGADINELKEMSASEVLIYNRNWLNLFREIELCRKPVIAAVNGWATGGGTELSLACDFVVCAKDAQFGLSEINIGVIPGAGAAVRLTRWVGRLRAKEILMMGRQFSGSQAAEWALANFAVPSTELINATQDMADTLSKQAPLALGAAKACVNIGADVAFDAGLEYELQEFVRLFGTEDQREGMSAFLNKRKPVYCGR